MNFAPQPDGNHAARKNIGTAIEMTPVKATLLSLFMLSGILMWGAAIYSADAAGDHLAVDGYGVVEAR